MKDSPRIKLLDGSYSPAFQEGRCVASRLEAVFHNTGNLLFLGAIRQKIPCAETVYDWSEFKKDCDVILLSMANFINPHTDVSVQAETLANSPAKKIVLIGCGAQAVDYDHFFELRPDTARFLRIISERSSSLGVHGQYTAELLRRHGFSNTRVIGCPSFYISGLQPPELRAGPATRIAIGATPTGDQRAHIRRLFSFGVANDAFYILQSEKELVGLFDGFGDCHQDFDFFRHYYLPKHTSLDAFTNWLRQRTAFYFDSAEWLSHLRSTDLYIGTRIHGAVAAIQAGCPALTLVHDTRTRELCSHFQLPSLELADFDSKAPVEHYLRLARYKDFRECYDLRLAEYTSFLYENGVCPSVSEMGSCDTLEPLMDLDAYGIGQSTRIRMAMQVVHDLSRASSTATSDATSSPNGVVDELLVRLPPVTKATSPSGGPSISAPLCLQGDVAARARSLADAVSAYTQSTGRNPEFVLGHDILPVTIPPGKLANCDVLNDRSQIIQKMPDRGAVVELGTQTGTFAGFILRTRPNVKLYTIDIDYSKFQSEALKPFLDNGRLETINGLSWEELRKFPEGFFSWIYVDASHFIDHVRQDLSAAKTRVEVGGYIVCNDYTPWSPFEAQPYGVMQAVNEFLVQEDFCVSHFALHPFGYHDIALRRCA